MDRSLRSALIAYYPCESGHLDQLVKDEHDQMPAMEYWKNDAKVEASAVDSSIATDGPVGNYFDMFYYSTSRFDVDLDANGYNGADTYLKFPTLSRSLTQPADTESLPSISFFVKPQINGEGKSYVEYNLFGDCLRVARDGTVTAQQLTNTAGGTEATTITSRAKLQDNKWSHVYWRLGDSHSPAKLYINGQRDNDQQGIIPEKHPSGIGGGFLPFTETSMFTMGHGSRVVDYINARGKNTTPYGQGRLGLDEIMFFNKDLSDDEILYLASALFHPGNTSVEESLTQTYIALSMDKATLTITDADIVNAVYGHHTYTVEAWFRYDMPFSANTVNESNDEDEEDPDKVIFFLRQPASWALGVTLDGRMAASRCYVDDHNVVKEQRVISTTILPTEWSHVTLAVNATGTVQLYHHAMQIATMIPPSDWSATRDIGIGLADPILTIGDPAFIGHFQSLSVSGVEKGPIGIRKSMYLGGVQAISEHARAHLYIGHGSNPAMLLGNAPLHVHLRQTPDASPTMKQVSFQTTSDISYRSWTDATKFTFDGHVDCGASVFDSHEYQPFTMDGWFEFGQVDMTEIAANAHEEYTIISSGQRLGASTGETSPATSSWRLYIDVSGTADTPKMKLMMEWRYFIRDTAHRRDPEYTHVYYIEELVDVVSGSWYHWALALTPRSLSADSDDQVYDWRFYVNGSRISNRKQPEQYIGAHVFSGSYNRSWINLRPRPLFIGAEFDQEAQPNGSTALDYLDTDKKPLSMTRNNFYGYIRFVRIWHSALEEQYIKSQYDWAFEVTDFESLIAYWALDSPIRIDIAGDNPCRASPYATAAVVINDIPLGTQLVPLPQMIFALPPDTIKRTIILEVTLLAEIFAAVVAKLVPVKVRMNRLVKLLHKLWLDATHNKVLKTCMWNIIRIFRGLKTSDIGGKMMLIGPNLLSLFKVGYTEGWLKQILSTFAFNPFALLRMLTRFIPYAGAAELVLDIAEAAWDILTAVTTYLQAQPEKERPLGVVIKDRTDNPPIDMVVGGAEVELTLVVNPKLPEGISTYELKVMSNQGNQRFPVIEFQDTLQFREDALEQTLKLKAFRPCPVPVVISFVPDILAPITLNLQAHSVIIRPEKPRLNAVRDGDGWIFNCEFVVEYDGDLNPGDQMVFTPDQDRELVFTPSRIVFEQPEESYKGVKRTASAQLSSLAKKSAPSTEVIISGKTLIVPKGKTLTDGSLIGPRVKAVVASTENIQEDIYIYGLNAGVGDCFLMFIDVKTTKQEGDKKTEFITQANAIVDSGYAWTMKNLLSLPLHGLQVPKIRNNVPEPESDIEIDLAICTHFDKDHIYGYNYLYKNIENGKLSKPSKPRLTWIPGATTVPEKRHDKPTPLTDPSGDMDAAMKKMHEEIAKKISDDLNASLSPDAIRRQIEEDIKGKIGIGIAGPNWTPTVQPPAPRPPVAPGPVPINIPINVPINIPDISGDIARKINDDVMRKINDDIAKGINIGINNPNYHPNPNVLLTTDSIVEGTSHDNLPMRAMAMFADDHPSSVVVSGTVQPTTTKRNFLDGQRLIGTCRANGWDIVTAPAQKTEKKDDVILEGIKFHYIGPDAATINAQVAARESSHAINRASIVHIMSSTRHPEFTSLWTGDTEEEQEPDKQTGKAFSGVRKALGLKPNEHKHFTMLKVGHHGSDLSNGPEYFKVVTADHYLISGNGEGCRPGHRTLSDILTGHAYRRNQIALFNAAEQTQADKDKRNANLLTVLLPPTIWVTNPFRNSNFTEWLSGEDFVDFNRQGGKIYFRNSASRKDKEGYLCWHVRNGEVFKPPVVGTGALHVSEFTKLTTARLTR